MGMGKNEQAYLHYRDETLERLLKESKEHNYDEMLQLLDRIKASFDEARRQYASDKSLFNLQICYYYFSILWEYIASFLYNFIFKHAWASQSKTATELKIRKDELSAWLEQEDDICQYLEVLLDELYELKKLIATAESELIEKQSIIQDLDNQLQAENSEITPADRKRIMQELANHVAERQRGTNDIIGLYQQIDQKIGDMMQVPQLAENMHTLESHVAGKVDKERSIQTCLTECSLIKHPVSEKLQLLLRNRTSASVENLKTALLNHPDYLQYPMLAKAVWEVAGVYFPSVIAGSTREEVVIAFFNQQDDRLIGLLAQIDEVDAADPTETSEETLNELLKSKQYLSELIHKVLLYNARFSPKYSLIYTKLDDIRASRKEEVEILELSQLCEKIDHPVAKRLHYFLKYQTPAGLSRLRDSIEKSSNYQNTKMLADAVWKAGEFFPDITLGMTREQALPSILERQDALKADAYMRNAELLTHTETEIVNLMTERELILEDVKDFEELSKLLNIKIKDLNKERDVLRVKINSSDSLDINLRNQTEIKRIKKEFSGIVDHLDYNAKQIDSCNKKLEEINEQLSVLETSKRDQVNCIQQPSVIYTQEGLNTLKKQCEGNAHPVIVALAKFLAHPIPSLLIELKIAMQANKTKLNSKTKKLIDEANHYYPDIHAQEHDVSSLLEKTSSAGFFKSQLEHNRPSNTLDADENPESQNRTKL